MQDSAYSWGWEGGLQFDISFGLSVSLTDAWPCATVVKWPFVKNKLRKNSCWKKPMHGNIFNSKTVAEVSCTLPLFWLVSVRHEGYSTHFMWTFSHRELFTKANCFLLFLLLGFSFVFFFSVFKCEVYMMLLILEGVTWLEVVFSMLFWPCIFFK